MNKSDLRMPNHQLIAHSLKIQKLCRKMHDKINLTYQIIPDNKLVSCNTNPKRMKATSYNFIKTRII